MQVKTSLLLVLVPTMLVGLSHGQVTHDEMADAISEAFKTYDNQLGEIKSYFKSLARQVMLQQFNFEQRIRTDGYSGVKSVRGGPHGPRNYYSKSVIGRRFIAVHDHADFVRTVGMGEFSAVINGVEFRTRHNDYQLVMPSTTSREYHATEPLPFPEVPPSVTRLRKIEDQVKEMQEYFRAFAAQDINIRDYRPYFKPVMCYMEGAWTLDESIAEPFPSDRHQLDATSWQKLQNSIRYGAYTGTKSRLENFADLPTAIMYVNSTTGEPSFAQWNYRILCSPIEEDIPTKYLKQIEDLSYTVPQGRVGGPNRNLRTARFVLFEHDEYRYEIYDLLDRIFYNITGKDNIPSNLRQASYGEKLFLPEKRPKELQDTSRYARSTELGGTDAMGNSFIARGFNDPNLFFAETTQPRVAPMISESCTSRRRRGKKIQECNSIETRFSWAIPLEILYMTPLLSWNPYNIPHDPDSKKSSTGGNKLNGGEGAAFNGTDRSHYYITPEEFYQGASRSADGADTARKGVWVKDKRGTARRCAASGTRILTDNIPGVGRVRLRYPIAPIHGEGSGVWKELNALSDYVMAQAVVTEEKSKLVNFRMSVTMQDPPGQHDHEFTLSVHEYKKIRDERETVTLRTSHDQGHSHELVVRYFNNRFEYKTCSGLRQCKDRHPKILIPDPDDVANIDNSQV